MTHPASATPLQWRVSRSTGVTDLWDLCLSGATRFRELFAALAAAAPLESAAR